MANLLIPGLSFSQTRKVTFEDTAAKHGSGLLEVFSTPAMVAFMEQTSLMAVRNYLEPGFGTVGTNICVSHNRAVSVGKTIECSATLTRIEGNSLFLTYPYRTKRAGLAKGLTQDILLMRSAL